MKIPSSFKATDKLGRVYDYTVESISRSVYRTIVHLYNWTTKRSTDVEPEWFRQRKIENDRMSTVSFEI